MLVEATMFGGYCYVALLWQWVTVTPVHGDVVSRGGSTWCLGNSSHFHNGSGAGWKGNLLSPEAEHKSTPIQPGSIWALMGLQDGLSERLLDRGARNLEVPVSVSCLLEDLGSWRREKLRREEADNFLFPVDKHLFKVAPSSSVNSQ